MSRKGALRLDYTGLGQEGLVERRPDSEFLIIRNRYYKVLLFRLHSSKDLPQELCLQLEGTNWSSVVRIGFEHSWGPSAGILKPTDKLAGIQHVLCEGHQWLYL